MTDSMRFSDIITRGVTVEWFEAVALVREITERIVEQPGAYSVPELFQIELRADGHVLVSGGTGTDEPVRRLGQLLQALLAQSAPPVQLRLAVAQATAPTPSFGNVSEFYDALGYFERPDRIEVLRGLYARVAGVPGPLQPIPLPSVDAIAPLPTPEPVQEEVRRPRNHAAWVAIAAAVLSIVGAVAYLRWGPRLEAEQVSGVALKATDAVGTALVSGINSVSERAGLGRLAPKDSTSVPAAPAPVERTGTAATAGRRPAGVRKPVVPRVAYDLEPAPAVGEPVNTPAMEKLRAMLASMSGKPSATTAAEPAAKPTVPDPTVYQTGAAGVVPPVGVRPQLPRELPTNVTKDQLARIELVVLPDGSVGSVKLLGHRNIHDAMFLSAVKAWEFKPALKDGQPVAYRKIVWMAFQ